MTDLKALKQSGFIPQRQEGLFCLRVKVTGGLVPVDKMLILADIAEKYGAGKLHLTSRQSVEIPFIKRKNIEAVRQRLSENGLAPADLRPGIRTIAACQGSEVCQCGLINSQDKAQMLQKRLVDEPERQIPIPHKFKIGITGCPNNCLKAEEHDIGLKGALIPSYNAEDCTHCGLCQKVCPAQAIKVSKTDLTYESDKCIHCGRCRNKCPENCWTGQEGIHLYFGGLFGNTIQAGRILGPTVTDDNAIVAIIQKALSYFETNGRKGERFGRTITRLGWDDFRSYME
ncbi:coenzyme F420 hydrogenase [Deltaproteobacteria bacterium Smac51]|nr:coenzyme F420 hydrogenase [Deltaproteobacteria bacterium Smac51]